MRYSPLAALFSHKPPHRQPALAYLPPRLSRAAHEASDTLNGIMVISFCDAHLGPLPAFFHILQTKAGSSPGAPAVQSSSASWHRPTSSLAGWGRCRGGGGGWDRAEPAVNTAPSAAG